MKGIKYLIVMILVLFIMNTLYSYEMKEFILSQDGKFLYLTDFSGKNIEKCRFPSKLIPKYISGENGLLCGLGENENIYLTDWYDIREYPDIKSMYDVLFLNKFYRDCCEKEAVGYNIEYCKKNKVERVLCSMEDDHGLGNLFIYAENEDHQEGRDKMNDKFRGEGVSSGVKGYFIILARSDYGYERYLEGFEKYLGEFSPGDGIPVEEPYITDVFFIKDNIVGILSDGEIIYYNVPTKKVKKEKLPKNLTEMLIKKKIVSYDSKGEEIYFMESKDKLNKVLYIYDLKSKKQRKLKIKLPEEIGGKYFDITMDGKYVVGGGIIYDLKKRKKIDFPSEYGRPIKFYIKKKEI